MFHKNIAKFVLGLKLLKFVDLILISSKRFWARPKGQDYPD